MAGASRIHVNNIAPYTEGATILIEAIVRETVDAALTATGVDNTDALALTKKVNVITGGAANTGVKLVTAESGAVQVVKNDTSSDKLVYPFLGDGIDSLTVSTGGFTVTARETVVFRCITDALWESDKEAMAAHVLATAAHGATGAVVGTSNLQTFITNVKTFMSGLLAIRNPADTFKYIFKGEAIVADREITLPLLVGNDVLVTEAMSQTLSNKLLVAVAGSVSAPSVAIGAADTGWYQLTGTKTAFSQDGVAVFIIQAGGINTAAVKPLAAIGTTPVGTVSITEQSYGKDVVTILTLNDFIIGTLPGAPGALAVGSVVYAFPAGQHYELVNALSDLALKVNGTAIVTDTGLGSVIASGAVATLDGTGTFEDRLTGQAITTGATGGAAVSAMEEPVATIAKNLPAVVKNVFLNSAGTWDASNLGNLTATGTIILKWTKMS